MTANELPWRVFDTASDGLYIVELFCVVCMTANELLWRVFDTASDGLYVVKSFCVVLRFLHDLKQ